MNTAGEKRTARAWNSQISLYYGATKWKTVGVEKQKSEFYNDRREYTTMGGGGGEGVQELQVGLKHQKARCENESNDVGMHSQCSIPCTSTPLPFSKDTKILLQLSRNGVISCPSWELLLKLWMCKHFARLFELSEVSTYTRQTHTSKSWAGFEPTVIAFGWWKRGNPHTKINLDNSFNSVRFMSAYFLPSYESFQRTTLHFQHTWTESQVRGKWLQTARRIVSQQDINCLHWQ
jgi:hypothetical protein